MPTLRTGAAGEEAIGWREIKVSYTTDQELMEVIKLLAPMSRNVKVKPQKRKI